MKYTVNKPKTFQRKGKFLSVGESIDMPDGPVTSALVTAGHILAKPAKPEKDSKAE